MAAAQGRDRPPVRRPHSGQALIIVALPYVGSVRGCFIVAATSRNNIIQTYHQTTAARMGPKDGSSPPASSTAAGLPLTIIPCLKRRTIMKKRRLHLSRTAILTAAITLLPAAGLGTALAVGPGTSEAQALNAAQPSPCSSGSTCGDHYTITVEQWIPQSSVVDPLMPVPLLYADTVDTILDVLDPNCLRPPVPPGAFFSTVRSSFHGDGHKAFGEPDRVRFEIEFDFDGQAITNFQIVEENVNPTIRNKTYTAHGAVIASCSATRTATFRGSAEQTSGTSFRMTSSGANPLVLGAPAFHTTVSGSINTNGDLELALNLTEFPSQGIQVTEDGQVLMTDIVNDVSCFSQSQVLGPGGALILFRGLTSSYDETVHAISGESLHLDLFSPLCH